MSPGEFARALGVNRQYLSGVRSGKRPLSLALAVRIEWLTTHGGLIEAAARQHRDRKS